MRNVFVGPNGVRAGWRALVFVALVVAMVVLGGRLIGPYLVAQTALGRATGPRFTIVAELATLCLPVIIATWIMGRIERRSGLSYGLVDRQGIGHFAWGTFWGFISLSGLVGVLVLTGHLAFDSVALTGGMAIRFALEWAVAFLIVGLTEEMAIRGYLQQVLTRGIGFWPAAIVLSVAFGAMAHWQYRRGDLRRCHRRTGRARVLLQPVAQRIPVVGDRQSHELGLGPVVLLWRAG
jgi:membrane protease YdiL (CAAX protease family)